MMKIAVIASVVVLLGGCAGSADHAIVSSYQVSDTGLGCSQLQTEMVKTQVIIDGVNADKADVSGADIMDGLLYFPFNLMAKSDNYEKALSAAGDRIKRLEELKKEKGCKTDVAETKSSAAQMTAELKELNQLYKDGALTADEYKTAKDKVLNGS